MVKLQIWIFVLSNWTRFSACQPENTGLCQTNTIPYTETARVNVAHNEVLSSRDPVPAWPPATALPQAWLVLSRGCEPQVAMSPSQL